QDQQDDETVLASNDNPVDPVNPVKCLAALGRRKQFLHLHQPPALLGGEIGSEGDGSGFEAVVVGAEQEGAVAGRDGAHERLVNGGRRGGGGGNGRVAVRLDRNSLPLPTPLRVLAREVQPALPRLSDGAGGVDGGRRAGRKSQQNRLAIGDGD